MRDAGMTKRMYSNGRRALWPCAGRNLTRLMSSIIRPTTTLPTLNLWPAHDLFMACTTSLIAVRLCARQWWLSYCNSSKRVFTAKNMLLGNMDNCRIAHYPKIKLPVSYFPSLQGNNTIIVSQKSIILKARSDELVPFKARAWSLLVVVFYFLFHTWHTPWLADTPWVGLHHAPGMGCMYGVLFY